MVVFFLGVGVPRNVRRDVWVRVLWNGGKGRRNGGRMRGGFIIICGGGDGCHQGVFFVVVLLRGEINVVVSSS